MTHVFISYHKQSSSDYARKLADHLIANGFDVWIDDRIDLGSRWERAIYKAIEGSRAVIVIMTPGAWESDWVNREYLYADSLKKPSFPLLLDGKNFPFYTGVQFNDVRGGKLPPESFFAVLTRAGVPRKSTRGTELASAPQAVALHRPATNPSSPNTVPHLREVGRSRRQFVTALIAIVLFAIAVIAAVIIVPPLLNSANANTSMPTHTLQSTETISPTASPSPPFTLVTCPNALPSRLYVGMRAQVVAGGVPNRMRAQPSISSAEVDRIPSGAEFDVIGNPECANGYAWIEVDYNGTIGWTVESEANSYWLEPMGE